MLYLQPLLSKPEREQFAREGGPSKEAAEAVHREAHGGVADEITEVKEGV